MSFKLISVLIVILGIAMGIALVVGTDTPARQQPEQAKPAEHRPAPNVVREVRTVDAKAVMREVSLPADDEAANRRAKSGAIGEFRQALPDATRHITYKNAAVIEIGDYKNPEADYYLQSPNRPSAIEIGKWQDPETYYQKTGYISVREVGDRIGMPGDPWPPSRNDQRAKNIGEPKQVTP